MTTLLEPSAENICFGCGGGNARGMRLTFELDETAQRVRAALRLGAEYQGGPGFIHGGIIATVLDEAMSKLSRFHKIQAVTAELSIEYLKPVGVDQDLLIEAHEIEKNGRAMRRSGEIRNLAGDVLVRGRAVFIEIGPRA